MHTHTYNSYREINHFFPTVSTLVYFSTKYISVKGYYDVNKNIILLTV